MLGNLKSKNKAKGSFGESLVAEFLEKTGCQIIVKNFKSKLGEIDIIFLDNKELVFSEIKSRTSLNYGFPSESVTFQKRKRIINTAKYFLYINHLSNWNIRFDIIEVYLCKKHKPIIHQIKNVFW